MSQVVLSRATADHAQKYVLCCWIPGNSIPKKTTACSSSPVLWAQGCQRCSVKYGREKPFCTTRLSQCWHLPAPAVLLHPRRGLALPLEHEGGCWSSGDAGPGRALHDSLALIHAGCSMPLCLSWQGSTSAAQKGKNITKLPPWVQKEMTNNKGELCMGNGFLRIALRPWVEADAWRQQCSNPAANTQIPDMGRKEKLLL